MAFVNFTPDAHSAPPPAAVVGTGSFADVVEAVSPAVVNIMVTQVSEAQPTLGFQRFGAPQGRGRSDQQEQLEEFFGRFFDAPQQQMPQRKVEGQGSGFIVDASGYIVTNNHVVDNATKIVVTTHDGRKLDATLVGHDPKTDLARDQGERDRLPHVAFGDSDKSRVGDWVLAIGNPFGLGGTATAGIISARGRDIQSGPYDDYLQIDAPINFGNSGGPVFNVGGEVVGVNTAIFSPNGGNIGIGFAIPANQAKNVIAQLRENGSVERGWLGVQIQDLDEELAASLGLEHEKGALVADVVGDGPAQHGGVLAGDVITKFNDHEIDARAHVEPRGRGREPEPDREHHRVARRQEPRAEGEARRSREGRASGGGAGPGERRRHRRARPHAARLDGRGQGAARNPEQRHGRARDRGRGGQRGGREGPAARRRDHEGESEGREHGGRRGRRAERGEGGQVAARCSWCAAATRNASWP